MGINLSRPEGLHCAIVYTIYYTQCHIAMPSDGIVMFSFVVVMIKNKYLKALV